MLVLASFPRGQLTVANDSAGWRCPSCFVKLVLLCGGLKSAKLHSLQQLEPGNQIVQS